MSKQVELNSNELTAFMSHIIKNNQKLQSEGKNSVAVEVVGESGIGKTSTMLQIAKDNELSYVKLNLAQIEELGDLVGYPIRQFQMAQNKGTEEKPEWSLVWADEHIIDAYKDKGYTATGKSQMSYCPPEWIADQTGGGILLLDDWNRADKQIIQAISC